VKKNIFKFAYIALALASMSALRQSSAFAQNIIAQTCTQACGSAETSCLNSCSAGGFAGGCFTGCQHGAADCNQGC
jgi:hypothetical protein